MVMVMSSLIFEEDGGVTARGSCAGLNRLSPRGKFGDETVKYMYSGACSTSNSTPYHILAIFRNRAGIPLTSTFVSTALPAVVCTARIFAKDLHTSRKCGENPLLFIILINAVYCIYVCIKAISPQV